MKKKKYDFHALVTPAKIAEIEREIWQETEAAEYDLARIAVYRKSLSMIRRAGKIFPNVKNELVRVGGSRISVLRTINAGARALRNPSGWQSET